MKIGIFSIPEGNERTVISACQERGVDYCTINLLADDWLEQFLQSPCDGYIIRAPAGMSIWRQIFYKRLLLLRESLDGRCVPTVDSLLYYESKISMADVCAIHGLSCVNTKVFFKYTEAIAYANAAKLPVVIKADGGSGGNCVAIIRSRVRLKWQVFRAFFIRNILRDVSITEFFKGKIRPFRTFLNSGYFPIQESNEGYILFQDYIDANHEWRMVVLGNSYFGHKKLKKKIKGKFSGSGKAAWDDPPKELLDLIRHCANILQVNSMGFDVLEDKNGHYYLNEMQAIIGAHAPSQMYINGIPGRYRCHDGEWIFEEGEFCRHKCDLLRVETLLEMLNTNR